jgi:ParB family chromosome partitioning protein
LIDPTAASAVLEVDVERIVPNPRQPRRHIEAEALGELARSIAADGLLQPLLVRDLENGTYELIAGERRWRAAQAAGLLRVPVTVRAADERTTLVLALVENLLREDLNAVEVARSYAVLTDELGLGVGELAARVGKSRAAVANTLRLLDLPDEALALVEEGALSEGHGRAILQAPGHEDRRRLARQAARDALSVRATEALARAAGRRRAPRRGPDWLDADVAVEAAESAYRAFGLPARLVPARGGARLEVQVRSAGDLAALAERLEHVATRVL